MALRDINTCKEFMQHYEFYLSIVLYPRNGGSGRYSFTKKKADLMVISKSVCNYMFGALLFFGWAVISYAEVTCPKESKKEIQHSFW